MENIKSNFQNGSNTKIRTSRRNVLISSASTASIISATGVSQAATSNDLTDSKESCHLTVVVTGLEIEGTLSDVSVTLGEQEQMTNNAGEATFEVNNGVYEIITEVDDWETKIKTVVIKEDSEQLHIPLHIKHYDDITVFVRDASCGDIVENATISMSGYGSRNTDCNGEATIMTNCGIEPQEYNLTVTAAGYHQEQRQVTIRDDKDIHIYIIPDSI